MPSWGLNAWKSHSSMRKDLEGILNHPFKVVLGFFGDYLFAENDFWSSDSKQWVEPHCEHFFELVFVVWIDRLHLLHNGCCLTFANPIGVRRAMIKLIYACRRPFQLRSRLHQCFELIVFRWRQHNPIPKDLRRFLRLWQAFLAFIWFLLFGLKDLLLLSSRESCLFLSYPI